MILSDPRILSPVRLPFRHPGTIFLERTVYHRSRGREGWWAHQDSNLGHDGYEPPVLTAELWAPRFVGHHDNPQSGELISLALIRHINIYRLKSRRNNPFTERIFLFRFLAFAISYLNESIS